MGEKDKNSTQDERDPKIETDEVEAHSEQADEDRPGWCGVNNL